MNEIEGRGVSGRDRTTVDQNSGSDYIFRMPGRTHPGAEDRTVGGRLMVCVMGLVGDGLSRGKTSGRQDAKHEEDGENPLNRRDVHNHTGSRRADGWYARPAR